MLALLRLVHLELFHRIELAFLVPGHSYMDCDRNFGKITSKLATYDSIPSPARLKEYIQLTQRSTTQNVFSLKREEIQDITVLTVTDKNKRVALVRRNADSFQTASVIVMRSAFPDGYLLKNNFKVYDKDAVFVKANLPKQKLDLGKIQFGMKYPRPRKIKQEKLDDLKKMRPSLGNDGVWVDVLLEDQKNSHAYADEEVYSLFPAETLGRDYSMERDPPVRIGNPNPEEDMGNNITEEDMDDSPEEDNND